MNPDYLLPVMSSAAWLMLACVGLASYRLGWRKIVTMGLAWILIFGGVYVLVEWFLVARGTASALM